MSFPAPTLELPVGRARLESLGAHHAPGLVRAGEDARVWRYIPWPQPRTVGEMDAFIESASAGDAQRAFAIIDRTTGAPAGSTRYLDIRLPNRSIEIGYTWIGTPWQRTSINTECKYLLMRYAFETLGVARVQLKTDARNTQSQAAIERIGAVREGVLRRSLVMPDGFIRDSVYFSVLDHEWPTVKQRLEARLATHRP